VNRDFPADTLPSMALWLARHMDRVRQHPAAADIVAEVTAAVRQAVRAIDRPPQRVYAGPCPALGCGTDLLTWPGHTRVTCAGCGTVHDIAVRQEQCAANWTTTWGRRGTPTRSAQHRRPVARARSAVGVAPRLGAAFVPAYRAGPGGTSIASGPSSTLRSPRREGRISGDRHPHKRRAAPAAS
jgi:hypothetical protein